MSNSMDGGELDGKQTRESCPNLTTATDVVNRVGFLSVDILNKEKVINELWSQIDKFTTDNSRLTDENNAFAVKVEMLERDSKSHKSLLIEAEKDKIAALSKYREKMELNKTDLESKDAEIKGLKSTLDSIEGAAVASQEEIRRELMVARKELRELKKKPSAAKKKANAKPARA